MILAFLKPTLRAKNPLTLAGASGGRFTWWVTLYFHGHFVQWHLIIILFVWKMKKLWEELVEERSERGGVWAGRMVSSIKHSGDKREEPNGSLLRQHRNWARSLPNPSSTHFTVLAVVDYVALRPLYLPHLRTNRFQGQDRGLFRKINHFPLVLYHSLASLCNATIENEGFFAIWCFHPYISTSVSYWY